MSVLPLSVSESLQLIYLPAAHSPRATDASKDEVRLRGDTKLIEKIKAELEAAASALESTVVMGVRVPQNAHASKIGRGGSALQDLQRSSGAT